DNLQILKDLALIQLQLRNYTGCIETRKRLVVLLRGSHQRTQFLCLAVLYHLLNNPTEALMQLDEYESSLISEAQPVPKNKTYSEVILYKNQLIEERGDLEAALKHLEGMESYIVDVPLYRYRRAQLLQKLGREEHAMGAFLQLLQMNPDHRPTIEGFIKSTRENRWDVLQDLANQFPKSTLIPLLLVEAFPVNNDSTDFEDYLRELLKKQIDKCIPSTYIQLKPILSIPEKFSIAGRILFDLESNTPLDHPSSPWIRFYLAQHFDSQRDYETAMTYVEKAIELSLQFELQTDLDENDETINGEYVETNNSSSRNASCHVNNKVPLELYMLKARIYKHTGHFDKACELMNAIREMDLKDRFVNTKCTKYMLRNNDLESAQKTIQLFTLPNIDPLKDLTDLQCMWFFTERAEALVRLGQYEEALDNYGKVFRHFDEIEDDQFDFHMYCLRRVCLSTYKDLLSMEQKLRRHPFYLRCAFGAISIYLHLHDTQTPWNLTNDIASPLEAALKLLKKMEEDGIDQPQWYSYSFEVYLRQERWLLALRALKKYAGEPSPRSYRFFFHVVQLSVAAQSHTMPGPFKNAIDKECQHWWESDSLLDYIQKTYEQHKHEFPYVLAVARSFLELQLTEQAEKVLQTWLDEVETGVSLWNNLKLKSFMTHLNEWNWLDRCQTIRSRLKSTIQAHFALE
ncbi:N-alpha-acetyltransferase 16, NatA auxiliary subunit, partial [Coelomomyces lativittatus]